MIVTDFTALPDHSWASTGWGNESPNTPVILSYSFPISATAAALAEFPGAGGYAGFNEQEKASARAALTQWASVSGITFVEVPQDQGDLRFLWFNFNSAGIGEYSGFGYYPFPEFDQNGNGPIFIPSYGNDVKDIGGDTFFNVNERGTFSNKNFTGLLLHEIGHAIGMKHPFESSYNPDTLASHLDNQSNTVMSYTGQYTGSLGQFDIQAAQYLYGGANSDGTQFSSWGYDPATYTLTATGTSLGEVLYGAGGTNDVIYAGAGNDYIATRSGHDWVYGEAGDDQVSAGPGNDLISGGLGFDLAAFSGPRSAYSIQQQSISYYQVIGPDGTDTVVNVERLQFSNQYFDLGVIAVDYSASASAVYQTMYGSAPSASTDSNLVNFATNQFEYGIIVGVWDPIIYLYQALGQGLVEGAVDFRADFDPSVLPNETQFVSQAYDSVFGNQPGQSQINHFLDQLEYFDGIYTASGHYGADEARIDLLARGAIFGQMLGIAYELDLV